MKTKYIIMDKKDNCATALRDIEQGEQLEIKNAKIIIKTKITLGHKFALIEIPQGEYIKKYGQIIGLATEKISQGDWIHTHNIKSNYLKEVVKR